MLEENINNINKLKDEKAYNFTTKHKNKFKSQKGLNEEIIREISKQKNEDKWMLNFRLKSFEIYKKLKTPNWGPNLNDLDLNNIHYYIKPEDKTHHSWEDVPKEIKDTFDKLGVPESERKFLAGTGAQFESEVVYHNLQEQLKDMGVIFESTDIALKKYPKLFKEYFGKVVPASDNKFAALNSAVWSGGSFIYIPKNVKIDLPLQAYFRINAENMGQFERTLIIAEKASSLHYIEGCTAPVYSTDSLHSAVVEIIVKDGAKVQYTTLQNWSKNVYNLVTKRAHAYADSKMYWLDVNLGSKITMKYPAIYLMGEKAQGEILSFAVSGKKQTIDAGAKIIHAAKNTSSIINSKSISKDGGISTYRGLIKINKNATKSKNKVNCDALLLDEISRSDTYPKNQIEEQDSQIEHEAHISKISKEQIFYLQSRGLDEESANSLIVNGFADSIITKLPMEYAVELSRLLELEMEGSIG